jgi:hypothetical protein
MPQARFSRLVLEKLPLFALAAADGAVTIFAQRSGGAMGLVLPLGVWKTPSTLMRCTCGKHSGWRDWRYFILTLVPRSRSGKSDWPRFLCSP